MCGVNILLLFTWLLCLNLAVPFKSHLNFTCVSDDCCCYAQYQHNQMLFNSLGQILAKILTTFTFMIWYYGHWLMCQYQLQLAFLKLALDQETHQKSNSANCTRSHIISLALAQFMPLSGQNNFTPWVLTRKQAQDQCSWTWQYDNLKCCSRCVLSAGN